jgi:tetratricopeptide (TPR) repeat protein
MRTPPRRPANAVPLERDIEDALQPGCFINYSVGWSFVEGLDRVEEKIAKLVRSAPARAVALYETFLAGAYEKAEELDDSSGSFGMFVDGLFSGWVQARQAAGADPDETARRLLAWMDNDACGFCYQLERNLVKVLDELGLAAFERRVRERFEAVTTAAAAPSGEREADPAHLRRRAAEILRAILAKQRNAKAYVALCEASEVSSADCLALAKMLQARRKTAEALAWVERGLTLERTRPSASADYELAKLKRDLLSKLGRGDEALEAAWAQFKAHPSKYSYADLMRYVPKTENSAWHAKAMDAAAGADLHSLIELWLETKEIERLIERLRQARDEEMEGISYYAAEPVAKKLANRHPDVAARMYRALSMRILKAKRSKHYDAALAYFKDARGCYERAGLGANWESLVREVRAEHYRKTGLMRGFEEVVAGGTASAKPTFLERAKRRWSQSPGS